MDTFAKGLKVAAKMKEDKFFDNLIADRYASFKSGIGADIVSGKANFKTLEAYAMQNSDIRNKSNHLELVKARLNEYLFGVK
ncbi:Xylose isomerase [compost metagenome]